MQSDELIREVDEDLQRERLARLWRRVRVPVLAAVAAAVVGTAGFTVYERLEARRLEAQALAFAAAEARAVGAAGGPAAAAPFLEVARDADPGFAAVARFRAARAQAEAGDLAAAAATLEGLATDGEADPLLRDLAALQAATLRADDAPPAELRARLDPLAAAGAPWRHQARELQALLDVRAGETARAREVLDGLALDADAPENLRRRAGELRDALAAGAAAGAAQPAAGPAGPTPAGS